jgi:glutathionyl-hydroquinone reductase
VLCVSGRKDRLKPGLQLDFKWGWFDRASCQRWPFRYRGRMAAQFPDEHSDSGEFKRQEDAFRQWVTADGSSPFAVENGRYNLYVSLACPWAHRTLIVRALLKLEEVIGVTVVDPVRDERGWAFREGPGHGKDPVNGFSFLSEAYRATDSSFRGRVTVPVLWDKQTGRIVNNSEDDICRMFAEVFAAERGDGIDLFPADLAEGEQEELSGLIYEKINNGVYRAGFATRQAAYERAVGGLFEALDQMEKRLASQRFLLGERIVETDWRLFCTLIRFDAVYFGHFKCNIRRIADYPNLDGYLRDLYQQPGIAETVNLDHIKRHYYGTHEDLNPSRIIPVGPRLDFDRPHGRDRLSAS